MKSLYLQTYQIIDCWTSYLIVLIECWTANFAVKKIHPCWGEARPEIQTALTLPHRISRPGPLSGTSAVHCKVHGLGLRLSNSGRNVQIIQKIRYFKNKNRYFNILETSYSIRGPPFLTCFPWSSFSFGKACILYLREALKKNTEIGKLVLPSQHAQSGYFGIPQPQ